MRNGVEMIAAERARQVSKEGWTPEHDAQHTRGQLGELAAYYCAKGPQEWLESVVYPAQWYMNAGKRQGFPMPTLRDLMKAGALIAAEIDRRISAGEEVPNAD